MCGPSLVHCQIVLKIAQPFLKINHHLYIVTGAIFSNGDYLVCPVRLVVRPVAAETEDVWPLAQDDSQQCRTTIITQRTTFCVL